MLSNFFAKVFPFVFVVFFIYFEHAPIYFFNNELVRPLMTFTTVFCWISSDETKFRPIWLLFFGLFYDILKDGIIGLTPIFFLILNHLQTRRSTILFADTMKENWLKFIVIVFFYFVSSYLINIFMESSSYNLYKNFVSFILTIILFPFFYSMIQKLSYKFGNYNE
tara:strand:- start:343 stop:840 length:498 start_codon:yes stop_codon:yes gene_type:complete